MLSEGFDAKASPGTEIRQSVAQRLSMLAEAGPGGLARALDALAAPDCQWRAAHPMNEMAGNQAAAADIWGPLLQAFPDLKRRDTILVAGRYQGRSYVAAARHVAPSWSDGHRSSCQNARGLAAMSPGFGKPD